MYIRFLFHIGECIYWVSFWGYKKYKAYITTHMIGDLEAGGRAVLGSDVRFQELRALGTESPSPTMPQFRGLGFRV